MNENQIRVHELQKNNLLKKHDFNAGSRSKRFKEENLDLKDIGAVQNSQTAFGVRSRSQLPEAGPLSQQIGSNIYQAIKVSQTRLNLSDNDDS